MCTLILLHRCVPGRPLVVAANRDEYLDRPAAGPALRQAPGGAVVCPLDRREGGTWLGINAHGLFAAVTNRPGAPRDPERRSRGLLVLDALGAPDAASAAGALERLPARAYNPFNLVVADGEEAFVAVYGDEPKVRALGAGSHVVCNADPNDRAVPKVARLLLEAGRCAELPADGVLGALRAVCRQHAGFASPLAETCIHTEAYGTRSSTLLAYDGVRRPAALHVSDGPPCTAAYEDFTPLLRELAGGSRRETDLEGKHLATNR